MREVEPLRCSECRREPRGDENADYEWRVESDGAGELMVFCSQCWEREFRDAFRGTA